MPTAEEDETTRTQRALVQTAQSTTQDLYSLLSLPNPNLDPNAPSATPAILKKAWRTTALKWHPDKNRGNEALAADKLDEARKAYDVLSDDAARGVFDARQRAVREKKEREGKMDEVKRRMVRDLEEGERMARSGGVGLWGGVKRRAPGEEESIEENARRLGEEARRRMAERSAQVRREMAEQNGTSATEPTAQENGHGERNVRAQEATGTGPSPSTHDDPLKAKEDALLARLKAFKKNKTTTEHTPNHAQEPENSSADTVPLEEETTTETNTPSTNVDSLQAREETLAAKLREYQKKKEVKQAKKKKGITNLEAL